MGSAKINQLQLLQQNLQNILSQKQQMQEQLMEINSALTELKKTETAYRIVGKIMIATHRDTLQSELHEKREVLEIRVKNFTEQEEKLKKNLEKTQKEVLEELKHDQPSN